MTEDKGFKHVVRAEARRTGRRYTEVQSELRPPGPEPDGPAMSPGEVAGKFAAITAVAERHIYDKDDVVRLAALGLIVPGNLLLSGTAGNGMTALGIGMATAIGGRLVSIDGRSGLDPGDTEEWTSSDVVVISHLDGLSPAEQVTVVAAGRRPALLLAKRHPVPERMPHPPDDETRERFLFGASFGYVDADTELRILAEVRDGGGSGATGPAVTAEDLTAMRAAARAVEVPEEVRRFVVDTLASIRSDPDVLLGASTVATIDLVGAAATVALVDGRGRATIDDANSMLVPVLAHRLVVRSGSVHELLDRTGSMAT
jgi:MoxR-like ATPase